MAQVEELYNKQTSLHKYSLNFKHRKDTDILQLYIQEQEQ